MSTPRRSAPRSMGTPMIEIREISAPCHIVAPCNPCNPCNPWQRITRITRTLELCKPRKPREGNHVSDVLHACGIHQEPLEAQPEARVGHRSEFAKLEVPPVILFRQLHLSNSVEQNLTALFALGATDDLPEPRDQHVHGANRLIVVIDFHVEGLDLLRI